MNCHQCLPYDYSYYYWRGVYNKSVHSIDRHVFFGLNETWMGRKFITKRKINNLFDVVTELMHIISNKWNYFIEIMSEIVCLWNFNGLQVRNLRGVKLCVSIRFPRYSAVEWHFFYHIQWLPSKTCKSKLEHIVLPVAKICKFLNRIWKGFLNPS